MNKNKKILFRADGNSTAGLGHLYRLFALVEMLKANFECVFLTSELSAKNVIPKEYEIKCIPAEVATIDEPDWLKKKFDPTKHIIIADGYAFTANYQQKLHKAGFKLMYIDDLAIEEMAADIVVNHAVGITANDYKKQPYTTMALGTNYAILRPPFLNATHKRRTITTVQHAFVCFGGADPKNLTAQTVRALFQFDEISEIHVVVGAAYQHAIDFDAPQSNKTIKIHKNITSDEMVNIMQLCQLAIVPSSTILYEVCAVQIPVLSGFYVENQARIYNGFLEHKAIFGLGDFNELSPEKLITSIAEVLQNKRLNNQLVKQRQLFDDQITDRYNQLILSLC